MAICPAGHSSAAEDYCDICGLPVSTEGSAAAPQTVQQDAPAGARCPICGTNNSPDALFCEACGYDFTTGTPPRSATPEPAQPVAAGPQADPAAEPSAADAGASDPAAPIPSSFDGGAPTASAWGTPPAPSAGDQATESPSPSVGWEQPSPGPGDAAVPPDGTTGEPGAGVPGIVDGQPAGDQPGTPTPADPAQPPPSGSSDQGAGSPQSGSDQMAGSREGQGPLIAAAGDPLAGTAPESGAPATPVPTPPSSRPIRPRPAAVDFVAEIWIDPAWYASQGSSDALPSPGLPEVIPLRATSALIGRTSISRSIHPDIDCDPDTGVSRRHAQVTTDGSRWWIEDLESANGTFIGPSAGALPTTPIGRGRVEFAPDQRIYLGGWTRIVIRPATDDEQQAFAG